eukprot:Tamp_26390.p1 GENE.Tamp_26390~~Tamp_26390.p1  ORF type:complete len:220 (-),score=2.37 Tamp_26390:240-899(-)
MGRDGRPLGLGASLPAAMWQELRKAASAGGSHGTGQGTSHGTSAAHSPYTHTLAHTHGGSSGAHTPYGGLQTWGTSSEYSGAHSAGGSSPNSRHRSNPYTAASHFSIASELSGVPRERDISELIPAEVAHLQRIARLDAKLGYHRDSSGTWHHKPPSQTQTQTHTPLVGLATVQTYGQDLCLSKATRKRFRLDAMHTKALAPLAKEMGTGSEFVGHMPT